MSEGKSVVKAQEEEGNIVVLGITTDQQELLIKGLENKELNLISVYQYLIENKEYFRGCTVTEGKNKLIIQKII